MTLFAHGFVSQQDLVEPVLVPGGTGLAAAGVLGAGFHDLVGDGVAAFSEAGFGGAHGFWWVVLRWIGVTLLR